MERLTRKETVIARGVETVACNYENGDCDDRCRYGTCRWQNKANMRLKEYEDTGLTPPEVRELKERNMAKEAIITGYNRSIGCKVGECPKCGTMARGYMNFCNDCGQHLKWED